MTTPRRTKPTLQELADLALDGDAPLDRALSAAGRRSDVVASHVRAVRRLERLLRLERRSVRTPDFTAAVLGEIEERRGWLDPRSRRLVWGGRALAAAALLLAIGLTLGVRRAAPEIADAPKESAALASMINAGREAATEATAPLSTVVETIESRKPVIATLTALGEGSGVPLRRLHGSTLGNQAVFVTVSRSPAPRTHAPRIIAEIELDPLSMRTFEAATGAGQNSRWVRLMTAGGHVEVAPPRRE